MIRTATVNGEELSFKAEEGLLFGDPTARFEDMIARVSAYRENALYQYLARNGADALPVIKRALFEDTDTDLRVNLLWALEWMQSPECREIGLALMIDRDHRVQEWANVFAWEMGWSDKDFRRPREFKH